MSILLKYSLGLATLLLVVVGAITGAALRYQYHSMTEQALLRGQSIAVNLASPAADALLQKNDLMLVGLALNATHDHQQVAYAAILDRNGRVKGHPDPKALGKALDFSEDGKFSADLGGATVRQGRAAGAAVWDIRVPVTLKGTKRVLGAVSVGIARESVQSAVRSSLWRLAGISAALLLAGLALTAFSVRVMVQPLRQLSQASRQVGSGNFDVQLPPHGKDELGVLVKNFNEMVQGLARAEQAHAAHMRIESELELARKIQASLLPEAPPQIPGLDVAFHCQPARELGGDFYDCLPIMGGSHWGFLIADVSGKGVPAAMHMANVLNIFRIVAADCLSPAAALKRVNALAYRDLKGQDFVTMIYAVLDPASGALSLVNAGHDPAFWATAGGEVRALEANAMPIGLGEAAEFDGDVGEHRLQLGPGDRLFAYTDGVTEALDGQGGLFGLERVSSFLAESAGASAAESVDRLALSLALFAGEAEIADDVTMLALRWKA